MAKQISPPSQPNLPKRSSPIQWLLIGISISIFVSIALQTCGVNIVNRTDKEKLIDKPHSDERRERDVPKDLDVEKD